MTPPREIVFRLNALVLQLISGIPWTQAQADEAARCVSEIAVACGQSELEARRALR